MKKVITNLLALTALCCVVTVGAWAQQETIFHYVYNGSSTLPNPGDIIDANGGKITIERNENSTKTLSSESFGYVANVPDDMKITEGSKAIKFGTSDIWLKIELTNGMFQAGDEISICGYQNYSVSTTNNNDADIAIINTGTDKSNYAIGNATIPETLSNISALYIRRAESTSAGFSSIKITRQASTPSISSFQIPYGDGKFVAATIDNEANTISAELPYGTDLSSIEPVITLQGTAKSYSPTGAQDFSSPVTYSIFASEDASGDALKTYTVTLTVEEAASTDATLSSITIDGTAIEGFDANTTEYNVVLPYSSSATMPVVAATTTDVAASIATITQPTSLPATVTITVTAGDGTTQMTYTVNISMATAPKVLTEAVFSNGFNAFIKQSVTSTDGTTDDSQGTVTAYYIAGTTAPTVSAENLACASGSATIDGDGNIVVTGEDNTTKIFTVSVEAVEPQAASSATITFDGTETWIKNGYGYDSSKGWKFSKNSEEPSNRRISEGKTRIYFFVGSCKEVTLTTATGITSNREIAVAVNNVNVPSITQAPKTPGSITIPVNSTSPAMIEIKSIIGDGGGDGGFGSISIVPSSTTGLQQVAISAISFNGKQILNPEGLQVNVFDATGRMVISSNNTAISLAQGAYIVKAAQNTLKVIVAE